MVVMVVSHPCDCSNYSQQKAQHIKIHTRTHTTNGLEPLFRSCHSQYLRKRCMERFQLVATIPRERGSSTSNGLATCSTPLKRKSGERGHIMHVLKCECACVRASMHAYTTNVCMTYVHVCVCMSTDTNFTFHKPTQGH